MLRLLRYTFSAFAGFSQSDRNLFMALEIKVIMQIDVKKYHLTNCHIGDMEGCSLQTGARGAYFTESIHP